MKNYSTPYIELIDTADADIITSSPGTETPRYEEGDGIWELDITHK